MHTYNEAITATVDPHHRPASFRWRGETWQVEEIHDHWVAMNPWWDSPAARRLRGEETAADDDSELFDEQQVWRVVGRSTRGRRGICDLHHARGRWLLLAVAD